MSVVTFFHVQMYALSTLRMQLIDIRGIWCFETESKAVEGSIEDNTAKQHTSLRENVNQTVLMQEEL